MIDTRTSREVSNAGWTVLGVALGAAVGAGAALLLAPTSGAATRERLRLAAREWSRRAADSLDDARDVVTSIGEDARTAVRAGQDSFAHDRVMHERPMEGVPSRDGSESLHHPGASLGKDEVIR